jgi:hypothetical protein
VLPIPLVVTAPRLGVYIRLHRRQGVHRVLSPVPKHSVSVCLCVRACVYK